MLLNPKTKRSPERGAGLGGGRRGGPRRQVGGPRPRGGPADGEGTHMHNFPAVLRSCSSPGFAKLRLPNSRAILGFVAFAALLRVASGAGADGAGIPGDQREEATSFVSRLLGDGWSEHLAQGKDITVSGGV